MTSMERRGDCLFRAYEAIVLLGVIGAAEAAAATPHYQAQQEVMMQAWDEFAATMAQEQWELYMRFEEEGAVLNMLTSEMTYIQGLRNGAAMPELGSKELHKAFLELHQALASAQLEDVQERSASNLARWHALLEQDK